MSLRSFANFLVNIESLQERVARGPQMRWALGHVLFSLCLNPSLHTGALKNRSGWKIKL